MKQVLKNKCKNSGDNNNGDSNDGNNVNNKTDTGIFKSRIKGINIDGSISNKRIDLNQPSREGLVEKEIHMGYRK